MGLMSAHTSGTVSQNDRLSLKTVSSGIGHMLAQSSVPAGNTFPQGRIMELARCNLYSRGEVTFKFCFEHGSCGY